MSRKRTANTEHDVVSDHPVCAAKEASRHSLNDAATPPHEEGIALASNFMCKAPRGRGTATSALLFQNTEVVITDILSRLIVKSLERQLVLIRGENAGGHI